MKRKTVTTKELHAIQAVACALCGLPPNQHIIVDADAGYEIRCVGPGTYKPRLPGAKEGEP